jgi:hypothetical protein
MKTQFTSKAIASFDPNFTVHQASFQDRTAVLKTNCCCIDIVGGFDGTHRNSFLSTHAGLLITNDGFRSLQNDIQVSALIAKNLKKVPRLRYSYMSRVDREIP